MRKVVTYITTADTKKTHEFPGDNLPQVWEVRLSITAIDDRGNPFTTMRSTSAFAYVERQTLVNTGLLPLCDKDKKPTPETEETAEDLILRLLEMVDVHPAE